MKPRIWFVLFSALILSCKQEPGPDVKKPELPEKKVSLVTCNRTAIPNDPPDLDSIVIDTCSFQGYTVVDSGYPDRNGRYTSSTQLFLNGKEIAFKDMFNEKVGELERIVSDSLNANTKANLAEEEFTHCFEQLEQQPDTSASYSVKDLQISFIGEAMFFSSPTGVYGNGCEPAVEIVTSIKAEDLLPYIKRVK